MPPKRKRRWPSSDDPRLSTPSYRALRKHWTKVVAEATARGGAIYCQATRCLLPGVPIRVGGQRTRAHLDVGHHIPRILDTRTEWTIDDTRPEHARCNRSAGVAIGRARAASKQGPKPDTLTLSHNDW